MTRIDDDLLMAYADGELPPEEVSRIEALLARDPVARERVRLYRESAAVARAAFAPTLEEPVPVALEERVREMARDDGRVVPFPAAARRRVLRRLALPLAASLALLIGFAAGSRMQPESESALLARALESTPSGAIGPGEVLPLATLKSADGRWCRQFERPRDGRVAQGVACREPDGRWRVVALLEQETGGDGGYRPAGGPEDPLAPFLEGLGLRAIDGEAEAGLIAVGWRRANP